MSTLAMILAVGMTISDGPGKVSGQVERGLDLSGEWEGTWQDSLGHLWEAKLRNGRLDCKRQNAIARGTLKSGDVEEGIYKWEGDQILICFTTERKVRPTSFRGGAGQELFILRRVKPHK